MRRWQRKMQDLLFAFGRERHNFFVCRRCCSLLMIYYGCHVCLLVRMMTNVMILLWNGSIRLRRWRWWSMLRLLHMFLNGNSRSNGRNLPKRFSQLDKDVGTIQGRPPVVRAARILEEPARRILLPNELHNFPRDARLFGSGRGLGKGGATFFDPLLEPHISLFM